MKGIILAGGNGTRLWPCTKVTSKQLLPIYDKPMIYYPLETLLRAGIREILIIAAPEHAGDFMNLLGSGEEFNARLLYKVQDKPKGLAQAFLIGESFLEKEPVAMILGDNIFEHDFRKSVEAFRQGAKIFVRIVQKPERFGVVELKNGEVKSIEEKPKNPKSPFAVTGMYLFDSTVVSKAKSLKPSKRSELEITDLIQLYLDEGTLSAEEITDTWIDAGTFESMFEATKFARDQALKAPFQQNIGQVSQIHRNPRSLVSPQPKARDALVRKH